MPTSVPKFQLSSSIGFGDMDQEGVLK